MDWVYLLVMTTFGIVSLLVAYFGALIASAFVPWVKQPVGMTVSIIAIWALTFVTLGAINGM